MKRHHQAEQQFSRMCVDRRIRNTCESWTFIMWTSKIRNRHKIHATIKLPHNSDLHTLSVCTTVETTFHQQQTAYIQSFCRKLSWPVHSRTLNTLSSRRNIVTFHVSHRWRKMYCGDAHLCVCLSLAAHPYYCTDPDVTCAVVGDAP